MRVHFRRCSCDTRPPDLDMTDTSVLARRVSFFTLLRAMQIYLRQVPAAAAAAAPTFQLASVHLFALRHCIFPHLQHSHSWKVNPLSKSVTPRFRLYSCLHHRRLIHLSALFIASLNVDHLVALTKLPNRNVNIHF